MSDGYKENTEKGGHHDEPPTTARPVAPPGHTKPEEATGGAGINRPPANDHSDDHDQHERAALLHGIGVARGVLRRQSSVLGARAKALVWAEKLLDDYQQELAAQWSIKTDKPFADAEERAKRIAELLRTSTTGMTPVETEHFHDELRKLQGDELMRTLYMREGRRWFEEITRAAVKQLAKSWRK